MVVPPLMASTWFLTKHCQFDELYQTVYGSLFDWAPLANVSPHCQNKSPPMPRVVREVVCQGASLAQGFCCAPSGGRLLAWLSGKAEDNHSHSSNKQGLPAAKQAAAWV